VFMLSKYEPLHLFPVPSTISANLRDALYQSGAKDDPRDADLLLDILLLYRDKLRRLSPDSEATRRVQNLAEKRRHAGRWWVRRDGGIMVSFSRAKRKFWFRLERWGCARCARKAEGVMR